MKPIIGIISRHGISSSNKNIDIIYTDIILSIYKSNGLPIGIPIDYFNDSYLSLCNGFIIEGGDAYSDGSKKIINKIKKKNIPVLGICLGMQEMSAKEKYINNIQNHLNITHDIIINKNSILYKILNQEKINVNSRHKSAIIKTNLSVAAKSMDNIIEAVEDKNNLFFIGLQWHPESMYTKDLNSRKIFKYFVNICRKLM